MTGKSKGDVEMRILIMGAGAMGSAVGGFMANAGHAVTLVGRDPHMAAIREHGLRITGIWGIHHTHALRPSRTRRDCSTAPSTSYSSR